MSWRDNLLDASWCGVPFYIESHELTGGRRLAPFEFPYRDKPRVEDLGRKGRAYNVEGYVLGDAYDQDRDALLDALENQNIIGELRHPYLGVLNLRAGEFRLRETQREGGIAYFAMQFLEDTDASSPSITISTAARVIAGIVAAIALVRTAYGIAVNVIANPVLLVGYAEGLLQASGFATLAGLQGLSAATINDLAQQIQLISATPADALATADAVSSAYQGIATAAIAASSASGLTSDPVTGQQIVVPMSAEASAGLLALCGWGATLPAVPTGTPLQRQRAVNQQAIIDLTRCHAALATCAVFAQIDFGNAAAALAARTAITSVLSDRIEAAAAAGQDDLSRGLQSLQSLVITDLMQRAQKLPQLGSYAVPSPIPALALAQSLYGDPSRAQQLIDLNSAFHPLFLPTSGLALSA